MTARTKATKREERSAIADVSRRVDALKKMTVAELVRTYREVFGEPTRSHNKDYLRKKIAWRIQELAEGGLSDRARTRIEELSDAAPIRWRRARATPTAPTATDIAITGDASSPERDPRLPAPGTVLVRSFKEAEHRVAVLSDGFEYRGVRYPSLSKIAREITGTNWNGFLFFGLESRHRKPIAKESA